MDVKTTFGRNLKLYRKAKKLSQEQLSEKVDISVKHLSSIERGLTFVSADLLEKLASSVEVPVSCLFVNEEEASFGGREILYNDAMLNTVDRSIEKHLTKAIREIKADIRQESHDF